MANSIVFKVFADTKEFESKFKNINKTAQKVTRNAAIAFTAFAAAIGVATKFAKEQQKVMNQTRAVIKSTGSAAGITAEEVFALGKEMQRLTTFGDETVVSATNLLLTFKLIGKDTLPRATKAVLDMSIAMNQGLKESAIQLGKALNDPILGLTAMRRVGIQFTKQQEDQIRTLTKAGNIMKAQGLILEELESQFGGSAEAAREGLGAFDALGNSLSDIGEEIALSVAPALIKVAEVLTDISDSLVDNKSFTTFLGVILLLGLAFSAIVVVLGAIVTAVTTVGGIAAAVIGGLVFLTGGVITIFSTLRGESDSTKDSLSGEDGLFPSATESAIGFTEQLQLVQEKMQEVEGEAFILGAALRAGLGGGEVGGEAGEGGGGGEGEAGGGIGSQFTAGFSAGLTEIKEKVTDITALGKTMALTFQKGMSTAFSDIILGAKTAKEAFAEMGKIMLKAIVNFVVEWLAFQLISKSTQLANLVLSKTLASATAAAWAPAATLRSLATAGANAPPAAAGIAATHLTSLTIAASSVFQKGAGRFPDDTIGLFNKKEALIPATISEEIRAGNLTLSGPEGPGDSSGPVFDFTGATFNGVTEEFVEEIFTKASENIANNTLAFSG